MTYDIVLFTDSTVGTWRMRPYGAYRLASELRDKGYSVKVVDWTCTIFQDYQLCAKLFKSLIGPNTLFAGFSSAHFHRKLVKTDQFDHYNDYYDARGYDDYCYPADLKRFEILVSQMKRYNPNLKIAYGGGYTHRNVKLSPVIDYIVYGLADTTIVELASHLKNKTPLKWTPGPHPKQKLIIHDELGLSFDFPNSLTRYAPEDHIRQGEALCLETSRGCMFKCKFCCYILLGRKTTDPKYHKEFDVLVQELKHNWENYKVNRYWMVDDTFNETTEKLKMISDAIKAAGVPDFKFFAYLRLDLIKKHPEQIALLKEMGLQAAYFGIETLHDPTLKLIGKPMKSAEVKKFLKELKMHWAGQVNIHAALILGLPYETPEIVKETLAWFEDPDCPVDSYGPHVLNLNESAPSIFGKNAEKFGYKILPSLPDQFDGGNIDAEWDNGIWTREECRKLVIKAAEEKFYSRRGVTSSWETIGLQNSGYKFEDIYRKPRLDFNRLEKLAILEKQFDNYINELCEYEGIER